jgi:protein SCO1/2
MIILALLFALLCCPPAHAAADLGVFAYDQHPGNQLPVADELRDEQGRAVTLGTVLAGRPTILALGYFRCPNLCGLVRNDLINALSRSGLDAPRDYSLVVLSIDPVETPADAAAARAQDTARFDHPEQIAGWHYLTGSAAAIKAITDAVGFRSQFNAEERQFLHPAGLVFLTGGGLVSGYLLGLGYQGGDVSLGITRAANGVTAAALPILLLCFHYDEATGRYTLAVMRLLQLGAVITVLAVAGTILLALRRERRPQ